MHCANKSASLGTEMCVSCMLYVRLSEFIVPPIMGQGIDIRCIFVFSVDGKFVVFL